MTCCVWLSHRGAVCCPACSNVASEPGRYGSDLRSCVKVEVAVRSVQCCFTAAETEVAVHSVQCCFTAAETEVAVRSVQCCFTSAETEVAVLGYRP